MTYATDRLYQEVAYVAYHFHWSLEDILDMEHPLRCRFVTEIVPTIGFWRAEEYHQRYFDKHQGHYSCHYIRGWVPAESEAPKTA